MTALLLSPLLHKNRKKNAMAVSPLSSCYNKKKGDDNVAIVAFIKMRTEGNGNKLLSPFAIQKKKKKKKAMVASYYHLL
jgi:hypothetical protein